MIVAALSAVYGAVATWRRRWYTGGGRQRRLTQPVISVGNLRVGGSGKTPVVAHIARLLQAHGDRPAILSRGYARQEPADGVTIVSDRSMVRTNVEHAGDEPFLLARALPGVPVLVCTNRYDAGLQAESKFGATVHLLDDGFQHVRLARDIDLLLVDASDLTDRVLPAGRLREPVANGAAAHAVIAPVTDQAAANAIASQVGVSTAFTMTRELGALVSLAGPLPSPDTPLLAVAGIARPERFFNDLRAEGARVVGTLVFPDHHAFTAADLEQIVAAAHEHGATSVVTTEKDAVRMQGLERAGIPFAAVPLSVRIEPADEFAAWLLARLAAARAARSAAR